MANILFVESDSVAVKAFTGIINRSAHAVTHVSTVQGAWDALLNDKFYDILVLEFKLDDGSGRSFLSALRKHPFLCKQHVLVYTRVTERDTIRQVLLLDVQNYLIKPYEDDKLYTEINRAAGSPWWRTFFEPNDAVCSRIGMEEKDLIEHYETILKTIDSFPLKAADWIDNHTVSLLRLLKISEKIGFISFYEILNKLFEYVRVERPQEVQTILDTFPVVTRLIEEWLNVGIHTLIANNDATVEKVVQEKRQGLRSTQRVATWEDVKAKVNQLEGYPVLESVAATFQMAAKNQDIEIQALSGMIDTDPCLSIQVIYYTNCLSKLSSKHGSNIDAPKQAIQMLGLTRMRAIAMSLTTIPDEDLKFRGFDWKKYWMFQVASAMLCQEIVSMLSLQIDTNRAYFAGLIHELGKIILCYFYPEEYEHAIEYAYGTSIPLVETEEHYFGCTHIQVGTLFAEMAKLSTPLIACIRNHSNPTDAPESARELVAVVSLADYLCKYHEIGFSGSRLPRDIHSFAAHPSWGVLKPVLYNGFTVAKFDHVIKERIRALKRELIGLADRRVM